MRGWNTFLKLTGMKNVTYHNDNFQKKMSL